MTGGKTEAPPNSFDLTSPKSFPQIAAIPDAQLVVPNPTAVLTLDTQRIVMAGANGEAPAFPDARWVDNLPIVIQNRVIEGFGNAGYDKVGTDAGGLTSYLIAIMQGLAVQAGAGASCRDLKGLVDTSLVMWPSK